MTTTAETYAETVAREKRERRQKAETAAAALAPAMTAATGEPWTSAVDEEAYDPSFTVSRARDRLTFRLSAETYRHPKAWACYAASLHTADGVRLWLGDHRRRDETLSANIGTAKTPDQIARDLVRRLLPVAEEVSRRALDARRQEQERAAWLDATAARLIEASRDRVPLELTHQHDTNKSSRRELRHWGTPYVTVTLDAYDRQTKVAVDDLPPETALAMLAQLPAAEVDP